MSEGTSFTAHGLLVEAQGFERCREPALVACWTMSNTPGGLVWAPLITDCLALERDSARHFQPEGLAELAACVVVLGATALTLPAPPGGEWHDLLRGWLILVLCGADIAASLTTAPMFGRRRTALRPVTPRDVADAVRRGTWQQGPVSGRAERPGC